ncbi:MAG: aldehyde ferredoxin oxidoreductase family protein [Bacillota bacterium]
MSNPAVRTFGHTLIVDLTTGTVSTQDLDKNVIREYLGGSYLGTYLWLESARLEVDPLSAANSLVVAPGLLTGYPALTASRASFVSKSPLTGLLSESTVGGYFGPKLKAAGHDALVVKGAAQAPTYLFIDGDAGTAEILPAGSLWGQDIFTTDRLLKDLHGEDVEVAAIGPAGENGVYYACVIAGGVESRAAGRTGMGAVMGSKNLKAIVVRGGKNPRPVDARGLALQMRDLLVRINDKSQAFMQYGTAGGIISSEASGDLPIQNWKGGSFPGAAKITGQAMWENGMVTGHYTCFSCPIHCGKHIKLGVGDRAGQPSHGPEYENIAAFGSLCMNEDPQYVAAANDLANRLGLDTISAGNAIAFSMEAYERGIIDDDLAGRPLPWGDGEAILYLLREIAYQRGIGAVLSKGVRAAAETLGPLAKEFAVHVKGLELPFHDPRAFTSMALTYATAMRGACHLEGLTYYVESGTYPKDKLDITTDLVPSGTEGKAEVAAKMQDFLTMFNALGICKFLLRPQVTPAELAGWVKSACGIELSGDDIMRWGEREFNLRRLCNVALGITRKDDTLPPRLLSQPRPSGRAAGVVPFLGKMLDEYYRLRGWDAEGLPTLSTLRRLDLVDYLDKLGIRKRVLSE